jgi:putative ABC transport system permease protein
MFKNFIKTALRSLVRDKYYSAINILGLAVGLTVAILIILYIYDELTFDRYHERHDRIYRLESDFTLDNKPNKFAVTQGPLGPTLMDEYPEIVNYARCVPVGTLYLKDGENEFQEDSLWFADSTFFDLFTHPFVYGDPDKALTRPNTMVITESFARRHMGKENPLGKTLRDIDNHVYEVTGVISDLPSNSHFKFNGLISVATVGERIGADRLNDRSAGSFWNVGIYTYVLLGENSSFQDVLDKFPGFYDKYMKEVGDQIKGSFTLMGTPLADVHLNPENLGYDLPKGNRSYIFIFLFAAAFILIIASINYMNMATARSARRSREVGMRKVAGSSRQLLIRQFLGESVLIALLSFLISIVLVRLLLPLFNDLTGKSIGLGFLEMKEVYLAGLGIALLVGVLSGLYPAFYLSGFNPVVVLKGFASSGRGGESFRKALVLVQFTISVILVIGTMTVSGQLRFMKTTELGFDKENVIVMTVRDTTLQKSFDSFREELLSNPDILAVSQSSSNPGSNVGIIVQRIEGEGGELVDKGVNLYGVGYGYTDMMGIEIIQGRGYDRNMGTDASDAFIINETAAREFGWGEDAVGKRWQFGIQLAGPPNRDGKVVGVFRDFHYASLHNKIEPIVLILQDNPRNLQLFDIRTSGKNTEAVLSFIDSKRSEFGDRYPFEYDFLADNLNEYYRAEIVIGRIFRYFTILTIFIAALGLLGLSAFMAQQRTREIGIRKVMGSSVSGVVILFLKEFSKWVLIANLIAWPVAWYGMNRWLQDFQYRIDISVWLFAGALLLSLAVALITVFWQSMRVALINPAESLKYE